METIEQEIKKRMMLLIIMFTAFGFGPLAFMIAVAFINDFSGNADQKLTIIFNFIAFLSAVVFISLSKVIYKRKSETVIMSNLTLSERLANYQSTCIITWALYEGAAIISIIAYFATSSYNFIGLYGAVFVFYLLEFPSPEKFKTGFCK